MNIETTPREIIRQLARSGWNDGPTGIDVEIYTEGMTEDLDAVLEGDSYHLCLEYVIPGLHAQCEANTAHLLCYRACQELEEGVIDGRASVAFEEAAYGEWS
ncbi:hypothetical protein K0U83_00145 [bacterium]|nr:hypothetical protein [bacterium]